jgi:protein gp37
MIEYYKPYGALAMNKQQRNCKSRGIEWTDWTWNPTAGCMHGCTWRMPDGSIAECYAKKIAEGLAKAAYPEGFEHHYWREQALDAPLKEMTPSRIFVGSMADLFGHWVPADQIGQVLEVMEQAYWHTFQTLSKYPVRLPEFNPFPRNVWVGVSLPAGRLMPQHGGVRALEAYLRKMRNIDASVRFMSLEPLWFDAGRVFAEWVEEYGALPFEWLIVGAATNGPKTYQPEPAWINTLLGVLDDQQIPVFFKGNLEWSPWREEFPEPARVCTISSAELISI